MTTSLSPKSRGDQVHSVCMDPSQSHPGEDMPCVPSQEYQQRLNNAAREMLAPQEGSYFSPILRKINQQLKQYRLQDRVTPYEVFNEAYNRAVEKSNKCEEIENVPAWFRKTCFYIISEWNRDFKRRDGYLPHNSSDDDRNSDQIQELHPEPLNCSNPLDIIARMDIFKSLSPLDQKILLLYATGLSWDEVAERMIESGDFTSDRQQVAQTIAQRASRARRKMRDQYYDQA